MKILILAIPIPPGRDCKFIAKSADVLLTFRPMAGNSSHPFRRWSLTLYLTLIALCLAGCAAATHYHERQSGRVTFYLKAPGARGVVFASSLDAFSPHPASKMDGSRWVVSVAASSEFRYFYIVDGSVYVPECQYYENDDFGSRNCVYVLE